MTDTTNAVQAIYDTGKAMNMDEHRLVVQMITQQVFIRDYFEVNDRDGELAHANDVLAEIGRRFTPDHTWTNNDSHIVCSGCNVSVDLYETSCN